MITYYTKEGKSTCADIDHVPFNRLHREDGPALIFSNGRKEWRINGKRHRTNGPAIEWEFGRKDWLINGKLHRLDGPAVEWNDGSKEWYVNSKLHRLDGPAIEWNDGEREYWINGKVIETLEVETWINNNNINLKTKQHQVLFMVVFG